MKVAGIRTNERMIWADVGEHNIALLDEVTVRTGGTERQGTIVITPDQLMNPPEPDGEIIALRPRVQPDLNCENLPGSHMPPLGSRVEIGGAEGMVVGLDVPNNRVTVRSDDTDLTVPSDTLHRVP